MSEFRKTYPGNLYFVTLTVEGWVDIFTRDIYRDEIIANLQYCQKNEGLLIYEYVLMTNHLHMIAAREYDTLGELLGRFKSFTAKKILNLIKTNPEESRKEWLLNLFEHFARKNKQYSDYHFWHYTTHPTELWSNDVIEEKAEYIHCNPVKAGFVKEPHHFLYSSACPDSPLKVLEL